MNKLLEKYKVREDKKPIITLKDFYKRRFFISIVTILSCLIMFILKNTYLVYLIPKLIACAMMLIDALLSSKYKLECSDELVEYNKNIINNLISELLILCYCIIMMISLFKEISINIAFDFPTLIFIFYIFRFLKSGLFLLLDYEEEDEE